MIFETPAAYWEATGGDVRRWLALTAQTLRSLATSGLGELEDPEAEEVKTRLDGIAMVFLGATMRPASNPAGAAVAANIADGFYRLGDIAESPASGRALMALAVDRDDSTTFLSLDQGEPVAESTGYRVGGALVTGLSELLDAFWSQLQQIEGT